LALNDNPRDLTLPSRKDFSHEPLALGFAIVLMENLGMRMDGYQENKIGGKELWNGL
jgi:hypothetical protein